MTVSTNDVHISYAGSGGTGPFTYNFKIFADADLKVEKVVDSTGVVETLVLTSGYTVSDAGEDAGGEVTTIANVESGETLHIYLNLALTQPTDFVNNDGFDEDVVEDALDRLALLIKQANELIERCPRLPLTDGEQSELGIASARANKYLGFDANGDFALLS